MNEDLLKKNLDGIFNIMDPCLSNCDIIAEVVDFLSKLTEFSYSPNNRSLAMAVLNRLFQISNVITQYFNIDQDFFIFKNFYLYSFADEVMISAVIDFCRVQRSVMSKWMSSEVTIYQQLLALVLDLLKHPCLEIADYSLDAIPSLFPNVHNSEYANIRQIAQGAIDTLVQNLIIGMQLNNINSPEFHDRK